MRLVGCKGGQLQREGLSSSGRMGKRKLKMQWEDLEEAIGSGDFVAKANVLYVVLILRQSKMTFPSVVVLPSYFTVVLCMCFFPP